jgi:hypothetical protein
VTGAARLRTRPLAVKSDRAALAAAPAFAKAVMWCKLADRRRLRRATVQSIGAEARALAVVYGLKAARELQLLELQVARHEMDRRGVGGHACVQRAVAHDALVIVGTIAGLHRATRRVKGVDVLRLLRARRKMNPTPIGWTSSKTVESAHATARSARRRGPRAERTAQPKQVPVPRPHRDDRPHNDPHTRSPNRASLVPPPCARGTYAGHPPTSLPY